MNLTKTTVGNRRTLELTGRFDFSGHRLFREAVKEAIADPRISILQIDLNAVDYVDSSALGMLLLTRENAQAANKTVAIAKANGTVKDVLRIAHFEKLFVME
jgi:anti-anti-sigma factor